MAFVLAELTRHLRTPRKPVCANAGVVSAVLHLPEHDNTRPGVDEAGAGARCPVGISTCQVADDQQGVSPRAAVRGDARAIELASAKSRLWAKPCP